MKVKRGGHTYEVLKDGKPLLGRMAGLEAFMAFVPSCFRFIAVAQFPTSFGLEAKDDLRAVTFAVDEGYVDTVIEAVEKRWPKTILGFGRIRAKRAPR